jgi:bla regulator protein BlaR1
MERLILECAIRAALIAAVTALVLIVTKVKSAAAKHAAWSTVLVLMLLLPAWTAWGPKAELSVLPPAERVLVPESAGATQPPRPPITDPSQPQNNARRSDADWPNVMLGIYLLGLAILLLRLLLGTARAHALIREATRRDGRLTHLSCIAPVTVGWLHPLVIMPERWSEWPAGQLDAVTLHESEHARRRDPLVQWLALLNRAIFWFHPVAWWLERRLAALAEGACDAAVLQRGHDPRDYSDYLLEIARSVATQGARVNLWTPAALGMEMPGSFLSQRIRLILEAGPAPRISRAGLVGILASCILSSALVASGSLGHRQQRPAGLLAQAQTAAHTPAFEVASVKPNKSSATTTTGRGGSIRFSGSAQQDRMYGLTMENCTLWKIIGASYGFGEDKDYALTGPDWLKSERYDIVAKLPSDMPKDRLQAAERLQLMLRSLLAERFKLAVHHESKMLSAYALIVAKGGSKMREAEPGQGRMTSGPGSLAGQTPMSHFADLLSQKLDRPVIDLTDRKGVYDLKLEWTPDLQTEPGAEDRTPADSSTKPSIFTAIQEQLGLRLEARKLPVDVLVVDHAEKVPTEN